MLDTNYDNDIIINSEEKNDINDNININIFDLKKYVKNILDFIEKMITNKIVFDNIFKLSIMPGLISKLTKLIQSNIKITTKMLEKICYENLIFFLVYPICVKFINKNKFKHIGG